MVLEEFFRYGRKHLPFVSCFCRLLKGREQSNLDSLWETVSLGHAVMNDMEHPPPR